VNVLMASVNALRDQGGRSRSQGEQACAAAAFLMSDWTGPKTTLSIPGRGRTEQNAGAASLGAARERSRSTRIPSSPAGRNSPHPNDYPDPAGPEEFEGCLPDARPPQH
jgi:hypothetical protein